MKKLLATALLLWSFSAIAQSGGNLTFAVFYNDEDASTIAGALNRSDLTNAQRQTAQKYWNGGIKNWASGVVTLSPCDDPNVPFDGKLIVITGPGLTKQGLADLLNSVAVNVGLPHPGGYLTALANDVLQCGVEPWPPA